MQRANDGKQRAINPTLKRRVELHISDKRMMRRKNTSPYAPFKGGQRKIYFDISIKTLAIRRIG